MAAATYNGVIDQGADWYINFTYEDSTGTPINLTGYTAALQLRSLPADSATALSLTTASGITITGATGLIAVHATAAETSAIDTGRYYYDLEVTAPSTGVKIRIIQGQFTVSAEVTR
jgi:hypothetical protein